MHGINDGGVVFSVSYGLRDEESLDESVLVTSILGGDRELFRHLVAAHKDAVYSIIMRQVADGDLAEELAQSTFIKAYKGLKSFRGDSAFRTWIIRIAINTTNSYFESKAYKQRRATESLDPAKHDRAFDVSDDESFRVTLFKKALGILTPKLREALVLCGLEGKKYDEAALLLGIPTGTVRSRLNKARLLVRDEVERSMRDGGCENE